MNSSDVKLKCCGNLLMRSTVFPRSVILKSILKSLIFNYPNLNYYRLGVSILLIVKPLSVLSVRKENQSLDVVLPFSIFVFNFFMKFTRGF